MSVFGLRKSKFTGLWLRVLWGFRCKGFALRMLGLIGFWDYKITV